MTEPLFSIGSYASATGLTASALRFYADAGLLVPDHVDERTGYRYYSSDSVERARLVSRLRSAGTPIEVLRTVAAELRRPTPAEPAVGVDGLELAAALEAASQVVDQEPPFDRVSLILGEHAALDVVATDRFRLSSHRLTAADTRHGSGRASLSPEHVADAVRWLRAGPREVDLTIPAAGVELNAGDRRLTMPRRGDHLPDHTAMVAPPATALARIELDRALARAALSHTTELVVVELRDDRVRIGDRVVGRVHRASAETSVTLTGSLLDATLAVLPGDVVIMEWADPRRPVHLTPPTVPHWRTVIMPARSE